MNASKKVEEIAELVRLCLKIPKLFTRTLSEINPVLVHAKGEEMFTFDTLRHSNRSEDCMLASTKEAIRTDEVGMMSCSKNAPVQGERPVSNNNNKSLYEAMKQSRRHSFADAGSHHRSVKYPFCTQASTYKRLGMTTSRNVGARRHMTLTN